MRGLLIGLGVVLLTASVAQAQARQGDRFVWDQPTAEVAQIDRFEVSIDGGAFAGVGRVACADCTPSAGLSSFQAVVPALTSGAHTFTVRACPATGSCGPAAPAFSFSVIIISAPSGLGVRSGGSE